MLFGLCIVFTNLEVLIEKVCESSIRIIVFYYFNDDYINEEIAEKLIEIFNTVLKLLTKSSLKCMATKWFLFTQIFHYLWRVILNLIIYGNFAKLNSNQEWLITNKSTNPVIKITKEILFQPMRTLINLTTKFYVQNI